MKKMTLSIAAAALSIAGSTVALAAELPTYEVNGFPASPVQVRLLGAAHVQEQAAVPGTIASPHQASVLTPRSKVKTATAAPVTTGVSR